MEYSWRYDLSETVHFWAMVDRKNNSAKLTRERASAAKPTRSPRPHGIVASARTMRHSKKLSITYLREHRRLLAPYSFCPCAQCGRSRVWRVRGASLSYVRFYLIRGEPLIMLFTGPHVPVPIFEGRALGRVFCEVLVFTKY